MNGGQLYAGSVTWAGLYAIVLVGVVLLVCAGVVVAAWWDRRNDAPTVQGVDAIFDRAPLPDLPRAWLVVGARVRHDVLHLGTVVDATPAHAPYAGQVLVRFDALSEARWIRPRELDPVTAVDEADVRRLDERRAARAVFLTPHRPNDERVRQVWPAHCGSRGGCYWHGSGCGEPNPLAYGDRSYCCATCPTRATTAGGAP